jgi:hypothetical protein
MVVAVPVALVAMVPVPVQLELRKLVVPPEAKIIVAPAPRLPPPLSVVAAEKVRLALAPTDIVELIVIAAATVLVSLAAMASVPAPLITAQSGSVSSVTV